MPRTNEYSQPTADVLREMQIRNELGNRYKAASKAAFVAFYHYDKHRDPMVFVTPIEVSGQVETRGSRASKLPHPQNDMARAEAESAAADHHFKTLRSLREGDWRGLGLTQPLPPPYRVSQRTVGDKGSCDKCESTSIALAQYAERLWPGNQQGDPDLERVAGQMDSLYLREGAHETNSAHPGRRRDGQWQSQYGSSSAVPTVTDGVATWKNKLYGDEPSTRNQDRPGYYGGYGGAPTVDDSPYTSTEYSESSRAPSTRSGSKAGSDTNRSNSPASDGTGVSGWSNEAERPTNYLPGANPADYLPESSAAAQSTAIRRPTTSGDVYASTVAHPNTHIPETRAEPDLRLSSDRNWAYLNNAPYKLEARATVGDSVTHVYRSHDPSHSTLGIQFGSDGRVKDFMASGDKAEKTLGDIARAGGRVESYSERVYAGYGTGDHRKKHHTGHQQKKKGGPTA
ncbi:hypothetical protein AB0J80_23670 [Actinoplanes sp. NPDC049548]|uniref:hypothetical protein n=1 Tax=Actinoplanes sp. NPDC049548 TaxID=3155152 RepID=UPI0034392409